MIPFVLGAIAFSLMGGFLLLATRRGQTEIDTAVAMVRVRRAGDRAALLSQRGLDAIGAGDLNFNPSAFLRNSRLAAETAWQAWTAHETGALGVIFDGDGQAQFEAAMKATARAMPTVVEDGIERTGVIVNAVHDPADGDAITVEFRCTGCGSDVQWDNVSKSGDAQAWLERWRWQRSAAAGAAADDHGSWLATAVERVTLLQAVAEIGDEDDDSPVTISATPIMTGSMLPIAAANGPGSVDVMRTITSGSGVSAIHATADDGRADPGAARPDATAAAGNIGAGTDATDASGASDANDGDDDSFDLDAPPAGFDLTSPAAGLDQATSE